MVPSGHELIDAPPDQEALHDMVQNIKAAMNSERSPLEEHSSDEALTPAQSFVLLSTLQLDAVVPHGGG